MEQFSKVIHELRIWFNQQSLIQILIPLRLILLFGGLGISLFHDIVFHAVPYRMNGFHNILNTLFYDIPLLTIAGFAYLLGVWLTLISKDVKLAAIAVWANVLIGLYPFTYMSLSSIIHAAVYIYLGYLIYKFSESSYVED